MLKYTYTRRLPMNKKKSDEQNTTATTATDTEKKGYYLKKQFVKSVAFTHTLKNPETYQFTSQPELNLSIRTIPTAINNNDYLVTLQIEIKGSCDQQSLFNLAVSYTGIFTLTNLSDHEKNLLLGIECPHMLYPSARRLVMDLILESGFPAMNLPALNFAKIYHEQAKQNAEKNKSTST